MRQRILLLSTVVFTVLAILVMTRVIDVGLLSTRSDSDAPVAGNDPAAIDAPDPKKPGLAVDANGRPVKRAAGSEIGDAPEEREPSEVSGTARQSGGGAIRGRIVSGAEHAPVEGAIVRLLRPDALFKYLRAPREGRYDELSAKTDAMGRFLFRDVVSSNGYALLAKRAAGAAVTRERIDLASRQSIDVGDLALGATGGLSGHVTGADGGPVEGARVAVCWAVKNEFEVVLADPDTLPWVEAETKTDVKGTWTCPVLEPGSKTVIVKAPSGLADVVTPVECPEGSVKGDVDVSLAGRLSVAGVVVWSDGSPIVGARVFAGIQPKPAGYTVETGADGTFRIGSLGKGICIVGALVQGLPLRLETKPSAGDEHMRIEFPLPGSMTGKVVVKATGKPVPQFRVLLSPTGEEQGTSLERWVTGQMTKVLGGTGFSSTDGSFRFERLRPGDYNLTVLAEGFPEGSGGPATVVQGRDVAVPTIELAEGNTISGLVSDAAGKPVPGARVLAVNDGPADEFSAEDVSQWFGDTPPIAVSDEAGVFRSRPMTPAAYRLIVSAPGLLSSVLAGVDVRTGSVEGVKATLPSGGHVRVRVLDHRGAPPGFGVPVHFCGDDGETRVRWTDVQGVLDAGPLHPGRYVVVRSGRAAHAAFIDDKGTWVEGTALYDRLRTVAGATEVVVREGSLPDVAIRLPRLALVHGRARVDGRATEGHIHLYSAEINYWNGSRGTAAADGAYTLPYVEPGRYTASLWIESENGDSRSYQFEPVDVPDVDDHVLDLEFKSK